MVKMDEANKSLLSLLLLSLLLLLLLLLLNINTFNQLEYQVPITLVENLYIIARESLLIEN